MGKYRYSACPPYNFYCLFWRYKFSGNKTRKTKGNIFFKSLVYRLCIAFFIHKLCIMGSCAVSAARYLVKLVISHWKAYFRKLFKHFYISFVSLLFYVCRCVKKLFIFMVYKKPNYMNFGFFTQKIIICRKFYAAYGFNTVFFSCLQKLLCSVYGIMVC